MVRSSPPNSARPVHASPDRHRPRIAAMERGPGPAKYKLPGTTGHINHIISKRKQPAYSFGTRTKQFSTTGTSSCSLGPVYFVAPNITKTGKEGSPKYSLPSRNKVYKKKCSPGPATYHAEVCFVQDPRAPSYSFGLKPEILLRKVRAANPSPCAYSLPSLTGPSIVSKRSNPAYSMTGRSKRGCFFEDTKKTPGPGSYNVVDCQVYGYKSPAYSLHNRCAQRDDNLRKPGPGAHSPEKVGSSSRKAPAYSFGIKHSAYLATATVK